MPIYSIQTPEGKILDIQAETPAEAMMGAQEWSKDQAKAADLKTTGGEDSPTMAALTGFANMAGAHLGEPIQAGLDYLHGKSAVNGKTFNTVGEYLDNVKDIDAARGRQHPTADTLGQMAGVGAAVAQAAASGGATALGRGATEVGAEGAGLAADAAMAGGAAKAVVPAVADAAVPAVADAAVPAAAADAAATASPGLAKQMAQNAAVGAGYNTVDQAAQGNFSNIPEAALMGAAIGGAIPVAAKGAGMAYDAAGNALGKAKGMLQHPGDLEALTPHTQQAEDVVNKLSQAHEDWNAATDAAYAKMRAQDGYFHKDAFSGLRNALDDALENYTPDMAKGAFSAADNVVDRLGKGAASLQDLDNARRTIGNAAGVIDPTAKKAAVDLKNAFDNYVQGITKPGTSAFKGSPEALQTLNDARQTFASGAQFFRSNDTSGKIIQDLLNPDKQMTSEVMANKLFGSTDLSPSSMNGASFVAQKIADHFGDSPFGQQIIDKLRLGMLQKVIGAPGQYSDSMLRKRMSLLLDTRGKEGAQALFNTTERAGLMDALNRNKLQELMQNMVNGVSHTGALPIIGGLGHGPLGAVAGMAMKGGAEMLKKRMAMNTQRDLMSAIGAIPPRPAPVSPPSVGLPRNPNMSLPIGVGYVGGQAGGLLQ